MKRNGQVDMVASSRGKVNQATFCSACRGRLNLCWRQGIQSDASVTAARNRFHTRFVERGRSETWLRYDEWEAMAATFDASDRPAATLTCSCDAAVYCEASEIPSSSLRGSWAMKSERRHELQHNVLADWLAKSAGRCSSRIRTSFWRPLMLVVVGGGRIRVVVAGIGRPDRPSVGRAQHRDATAAMWRIWQPVVGGPPRHDRRRHGSRRVGRRPSGRAAAINCS